MLRSRILPIASVLLAAAFASGGVLAARTARAGDAPPANDAATQVTALLGDFDTATAAKDEAALSAAIKKVSPLYKATQDAELRSKLMSALGKLVKQSKMTTARKDALNEMVATEDGKEAWKQIQGSYPADDQDDPTRWNCEFVTAVGALHPEGQAIDKLLESYKKGKSPEFAAKAVEALGKYHKSKQRERIFEEIVKAGKNMVPSRSAGKVPGADTQARWAAVSEGIGHALDELTGTKVGSAIEWFKKADEAKKNYKAFFVE